MSRRHKTWMQRDFSTIMRKKKWALILLFIFCVFMCIRCYNNVRILPEASDFKNLTIIDYYIYLLCGMYPYNPLTDDTFHLPSLWVIQHLALLVVVSGNFVKDLDGFGSQLIVRSGRKHWLIEKYLVSVGCATLLLLAILASSFVATLCTTGRISSFQHGFTRWIGVFLNSDLRHLIPLLCVPLFGFMFFAVFQNTMEFLFSPAISWMCVLGFLTVSAYFSTPFLLGNSTMLRRIFLYSGELYAAIRYIIYDCIGIIICVAAGFWRIRSKDFVRNKNT